MKYKSYKYLIIFIAFGFMEATVAQNFKKKFSENFKTNKDVEIHINASHTDVNVTTWNKNEVQVNAIIEVEGVDKGFNVAKTLLGQSSVFVSVPPPTVKLLLLPDWSVTELPSFKIKKPLVP